MKGEGSGGHAPTTFLQKIAFPKYFVMGVKFSLESPPPLLLNFSICVEAHITVSTDKMLLIKLIRHTIRAGKGTHFFKDLDDVSKNTSTHLGTFHRSCSTFPQMSSNYMLKKENIFVGILKKRMAIAKRKFDYAVKSA